MARDYGAFDVLVTMRDMADEEAGVDDVLFGCALRKEDLDAFVADVRELAASKYGAAAFSELVEADEQDAACTAAHRRASSDDVER
ncbi:MAG: hypothetical protein Q4B35_05250 [Slackia sp.]|nr:hypothetical protein [Slackia sp.]